jgi:hypothetical protein
MVPFGIIELFIKIVMMKLAEMRNIKPDDRVLFWYYAVCGDVNVG